MGTPLAACMSLLLFASAMAPAQTELELFPGSPVFPRFTADALQHSLSLTRVTENREWIGTKPCYYVCHRRGKERGAEDNGMEIALHLFEHKDEPG